MATTTITVASFQTALAECGDAISASSWATARLKYALAAAIHAGLYSKESDRGASMERQSTLDGLKGAIEMASAAVSRGTDNRRFINSGTDF